MHHPAMATATPVVAGLLLVTLGGCSDATAGSPGADAPATTPLGSPRATPSTAPNSSSSASSSASSSTASPDAVTPGLSAEEQQALDTYEGMWGAYAVAAETADHTTDRLAPFATGDALLVLIRGLSEAHEEGVVSRGRPVTNARVVEATPAENPTTITIVDCLDTTNWLQHWESTGELVDDASGGRRETTAVLTGANEAWIVTDLQVRGLGTC